MGVVAWAKKIWGAKWCQNVMFRWVYVVPSTK
nr:MAG TPA: hypothetical protein [Caudoviricetes sp.]DAS18031.1 MAG TPA: hypothetical protein [Caudoviricetes sp.]